MNDNEYCTAYFSNMANFKLEYSKYRHKQSKQYREGKARSKDIKSSSENMGSKHDSEDIKSNSETNEPEYHQIDENRRVGTRQNSDIECFEYEGIQFEELPQNKMRCGACHVECSRLIVHLNASTDCTKKIPTWHTLKQNIPSIGIDKD